MHVTVVSNNKRNNILARYLRIFEVSAPLTKGTQTRPAAVVMTHADGMSGSRDFHTLFLLCRIP